MPQATSPSTPAPAAQAPLPKAVPQAPVALSAEQFKNVGGGLPRGGWQSDAAPTSASSK